MCASNVSGVEMEEVVGAWADIVLFVVHIHVCVIKHGNLAMAKASQKGHSPWKPFCMCAFESEKKEKC